MLTHDEFQATLERMKALKFHKETLAKETKEINAQLDTVNGQLVEYFTTNDIQNINAHGQLFYLNAVNRVKIADEVALRSWLLEKDELDMVMGFNNQKLTGYYKGLEEAGEELPPGVETYLDTSVNMRKGE